MVINIWNLSHKEWNKIFFSILVPVIHFPNSEHKFSSIWHAIIYWLDNEMREKKTVLPNVPSIILILFFLSKKFYCLCCCRFPCRLLLFTDGRLCVLKKMSLEFKLGTNWCCVRREPLSGGFNVYKSLTRKLVQILPEVDL